VPDVLGLPVPAAGPLFWVALAAHVAAGLVCVVSGAGAALTQKGGSRHVRWGRTFVSGVGVLFVTMAVLVAIRWPRDTHLLGIGSVAAAAALVGLWDRRRGHHGDGVHLVAMGAAYVALVTGFYVDNGANLPLWDRMPGWTYWVLPSLVGGPIIARAAWRRHRVEVVQA
jgi:hypothetical protein